MTTAYFGPPGTFTEEALLTQPDLQKRLITEFGAIAPLDTTALPLTFAFTAGSTLQIATSPDPKQAWILGGVAQLVIDIELDLHGGTLTTSAGLGAPGVGAALVFENVVTASAGAVTACPAATARASRPRG